jgi:hypothetical protein
MVAAWPNRTAIDKTPFSISSRLQTFTAIAATYLE